MATTLTESPFPAVSPDNQVDARQLHTALQVGTHFAKWIQARIIEYDFVEGIDFKQQEVLFKKEKNPQGGRPLTDYLLTLDMAKELAMVERTPRGRQIRQYFIECEKQLRDSAAPSIDSGVYTAMEKFREINAFTLDTIQRHEFRIERIEKATFPGPDHLTVIQYLEQHGYPPISYGRIGGLSAQCAAESLRSRTCTSYARSTKNRRHVRTYSPTIIAAVVSRAVLDGRIPEPASTH
jgi:phage anti-repressor protein